MLDTVRPIETDSEAPSSPDVVYVSLELSRAKWLVTSLSAGGEKISRHVIADRDQTALLSLLEQLKGRAERRTGKDHLHSGSWLRRLLDPSRFDEQRYREPCGGVRIDRRLAKASTGKV